MFECIKFEGEGVVAGGAIVRGMAGRSAVCRRAAGEAVDSMGGRGRVAAGAAAGFGWLSSGSGRLGGCQCLKRARRGLAEDGRPRA